MIVDYLLSLLIFLPIFGGLILLMLPKEKHEWIKWTSLVVLIIELIVTLVLVSGFDIARSGFGASAMQFVEKTDWINLSLGSFGTISIQYYLGVDGLSIALILLSSIILLIGVISSWAIKENVKGYFILYMILSASIMGCFIALDFFLFYLFFEFMLLPMYFLIGMWGGKRREYASIKFFIYTLAGSILILIVMIALNISVVEPGTANHTFDLTLMMDSMNFLPDSILSITNTSTIGGLSFRAWGFLLLMVGFAIKLPAVPLHTWLPDAHVEAPTPISVVLAGVLLKVGGYGFYRIAYSIFPEGAFQFGWWIGLFGVMAIIYGALVAMSQKDLKRLVAYSSVSHMGFVLLGLAASTVESISGSLFQMFSHGIISAALFLIVGVLYDRSKDRQISSFSGLASKMPWFTTLTLITFFAALGLPGFSGFIAEFLILAGAFDGAITNNIISASMPILGTFGLILGAAYFLWTLQRIFFGKFWLKNMDWQMLDLSKRELLMLVPLVILMLLFGLFPGKILELSNETITGFVNHIMVHGKENLNAAP